ncbi:MAG: RIP metalloprotease RseP [Bacteroidales bacterium]
MNFLIMAGQLILGLSILVLIHEAGHFLAARMFGIRVDKFYLFFDAWGWSLFKFKKGDTEYGIGWLPLGGYCKIAGMVDESMDKEQMKQAPQEYEYRSKPAWQRLIVIAAGVVLNLITGIVIFALLIFNQEKAYLSNEEVNKVGIYASSLARDLGFENGDRILSVNGKEIERFKDAQGFSVIFGSDITVDRHGEKKTIQVPKNAYKKLTNIGMRIFEPYYYPLIIDTVIPNLPAAKAGLDKGDRIIGLDSVTIKSFGDFREGIVNAKNKKVNITFLRNKDTLTRLVLIDSTGYVGLLASSPYNFKPYTFINSFYYGSKDAFEMISANAKGLGKIFTGEEKASESVQGPIGIASIYGNEWIWSRFWYITAMISLILAFMNILPIPGLDGGHIMFTLYEIITRHKPSDKFLEYSQMVGMFLLMALMVFAVGNDLFRLFK